MSAGNITTEAIHEYDEEAQWGLPEHLPRGERLLWQGRPDWRAMTRHALHIRKFAAYFAVLLVWMGLQVGPMAALRGAAAGGAVLGGLVLYAWMAARATVYTITDKRLVLRIGLVVPVTFNIPFRKITNAGVALFKDGFGDVAVQLAPTERIGYFILWPHARPWRLARAEPALRSIADAEHVSRVLARALAGSAGLTVVPAPVTAPVPVRPSAVAA